MLDKKKVGKTICFYRKKKEMTQKELAEKVHVSYQAVSRWELGVSLPTVEMIYDIAAALDVTVDTLLNGTVLEYRDICYKDTGLDTARLYAFKGQLQGLVTKKEQLVRAQFKEPAFFKIDTEKMKEPIYAVTTNVPGSKARLARQQGYDKEICADLVAKAINSVLFFGMKPVIIKAQIVCGNKDHEQLRGMAETLKKCCESNGVLFAGIEISAQPINYLPSEYELSLVQTAVGDREKILTGERIKEGDVLIGIMTEGLESICFPFIRVMLDRNPELAYAKIDKEHYFMEEILKPNIAYTNVITELIEKDLADGIIYVENSILNPSIYARVPKGLGVCIQMPDIPLTPLYRFMVELDFVGKKFFPYRFPFGIGMVVVVPEKQCSQTIKVISKYHDCYVIGRVEKNCEHAEEKVWTEGEIKW